MMKVYDGTPWMFTSGLKAFDAQHLPRWRLFPTRALFGHETAILWLSKGFIHAVLLSDVMPW